MMNSFNLTLSEKHFIYPSILNDSFAGYSNLACRSLPFMTWNTSFQPLLACKISFEKSAESYGNPFVSNCLSLAAFKILSLSLILGNVIMMCLGFFPPWIQLLWDSLSFLDFLESLFPLPDWGSSPSLCFQISFQCLAIPLLLLAPL